MDRYSVDEFAMHYRQFDSIGHIASPVDNFDRHSKFFMNLVNLLEFVEEFWLSAFLQKCRVLFCFLICWLNIGDLNISLILANFPEYSLYVGKQTMWRGKISK